MHATRHALAALSLAFGVVVTASAQTYERGGVLAPQVERPPHARPDASVGVLGETRTPRFVVQAIRFHANDETGSTNLGADEIIGVFSTGQYFLVTARYNDIDAGESRGFVPEQRCIYPAVDPDSLRNFAWGCRAEGGPGPLVFTITLREHDGEFPLGLGSHCTGGALAPFTSDVMRSGTRTPCEVQDAASSVIGRFHVSMSVADLVAAMPARGRFVEQEVLLGGPCPPQPPLCNGASDGEYTIVFRITRTADLVERTPASRR